MNSNNLEQTLKKLSDPGLCHALLRKIEAELDAPLCFMEVCGSHTVSIFRSGLRSLLPAKIMHVSGPGCPVCVTHEHEIAAFLKIVEYPEVIFTTFGDLMRVPDNNRRTLKHMQALGAKIEIIYSPQEALELAQKNPKKEVVFAGIGFETTAPTVAATIKMAKAAKIKNFSVMSAHKLVPPVLKSLLLEEQIPIDAFLLPGHVSTILGIEPYNFVAKEFKKPSVIAGFDPADILQSLLLMLQMRKSADIRIINQYSRAVADEGNPKARAILLDVFHVTDTLWRGLGLISKSGLAINEGYAEFDAWRKFNLSLPEGVENKLCKCGEVLKGLPPPKCPAFAKSCTPENPLGPCMVSTEGSCAAYYKYSLD